MQNRLALRVLGCLLGLVSLAGTANGQSCLNKIGNNCNFVVPVTGYVYFLQMGGGAGGDSSFGLGTSPTNFVAFYTGLPNDPQPTGEVLAGCFTAGTLLHLGISTSFAGQNGWAFATSRDLPSIVSFSDRDDSLGFGGSIVQQTGQSTWLLHLDDALSYLYDDDDDDILMQVRVAPGNGCR